MATSPPVLTKAQRAFLLTVGGLTPAHLTPGTKEYEATLQAYRAVQASPTKPISLKQAAQIRTQLVSTIRPPISIPAGTVDIPMTQNELTSVALHNEQATCQGEMQYANTYKIQGWDEGHNWVSVTVQATDKGMAEEKASAAGYDVKQVTRKIGEGEEVVAQAEIASSGGISSDEIERIRENVSDNAFLSGALDKAVDKNDADIYNEAVDEYNRVVKDANWYKLYQTYSSDKDKYKEGWEWFQETFKGKLDDSKYMRYIESDEFRSDYAKIIQPSNMTDAQYGRIQDFVSPEGFDSEAAYAAGEGDPSKAALIIAATSRFTLATISDETRSKIDSGEWTLLPYGQIIDSKNLEQMPPTFKQIVTTSGLVGFENYQEEVNEWNREQSAAGNILDAIGANAVRMGQDIKNFAILQLSMGRPEVKEGDPKPEVVGTRFVWQESPGTFTAEEAAAYNQQQAERQQYYKDIYEEADAVAEEWHASRPYLSAVYPAGFIDSAKEDPSSLKDPVLWGETIAATLPYTMATGLIVGGAALAGPAGVAASAPLAFGITLSVEGHDIYKDAIDNGASHDQALRLANQYGSISAAIETVGDSIFVGALGITSGAFSRSLGKNMGGNIIRGAAKKYGWKALTADVIKDFVNQGGQEFFQEVVHNAAVKTVNENQALLENTANAFVSGVIGTAPFVLIPAGGQAIRGLRGEWGTDVRGGKGRGISPIEITPQMQFRILNKVFQPVSGFTVSTKTVAMEQLKGTPEEIAFWKEQYKKGKGRTLYEGGKEITVGLIDKKTVVSGDKNVDETALAYADMCNKVNEYAAIQLKLKQAEKAIADFGLAKSKKQLETLEQYKKRANELEQQLKDLKGPMVESVKKFGEIFLKNSKGLEAQQKAEVKEMSQTIVLDIDAVTSQLFGKRNAKEIAKDIKELEGQVTLIEEEIKKGMTQEQLEGYARLIGILRTQIGDLTQELRRRYLSEGEKISPDTKKLTMEVMSLQARLMKAVGELGRYRGVALDYKTHRRGELGRQADVVMMERDTFEAIQKTTMAAWGRESYTSVLEQLNRMLSEIVSMMESLDSKKRAAKVVFDIYEALRKQDVKKLKAGVKLLQLEAGKIKDKPLQLAAQQQVKLLDTLTMENFWKRWEAQTVKKTSDDGYVAWYHSEESEDYQAQQTKRQAETIVERRIEELMRRAPQLLRKSGTEEEIQEWMERYYDKEYFETMYQGQFEDLNDFLDVEKEMSRIRMERERQEEIVALRRIKEMKENERDAAKSLRDKAEDPKWKKTLDDNLAQRERDIKQDEKRIQTITKTKLVIPPVKEVTREETEKMKVTKKEEKGKEGVSLEEQAEIERKAAQRIAIAKQQILKEGEKIDKREKQRESAFPGIRPKTAKDREREREAIGEGLEEYLARLGLAQALQMAKDEIKVGRGAVVTDTAIQTALEAGIYAYTKAQTRQLTKTQTQLAVRTAVKTALQTALETQLETKTETATKEELETATKIVTEIVTKEVIRPPIFIPPPPRLAKKGGKTYVKLPPGSWTWVQGKRYVGTALRPQWYYIPPPWDQPKPISLDYPPLGAKFTGASTPQETIQMIGKSKAKVPKSASIDLGVVDIIIDDYGQKISFKGKGLETVAGQRLSSATVGMSVPASGIMKVKGHKNRSNREKHMKTLALA